MPKIYKQILSDWKRYTGLHKKNINLLFFFIIFFHNPGMAFSVLYRIQHFLLFSKNKFVNLIGYIFYPVYFVITYFIFDIDIPPTVTFGKGLYIHNRGITFTNNVICGDNISIMGPITVGMRGILSNDNGVPLIGSNVTIYSGARVFGGIKIGNNVEIGANAVVGKNFPPNCVVAGVPAKIIKRK